MKVTDTGSSALPEKNNSIIEKQDNSSPISRHSYGCILKQKFVCRSLTFLRLEIYGIKCETVSRTVLTSFFLVFTFDLCEELN